MDASRPAASSRFLPITTCASTTSKQTDVEAFRRLATNRTIDATSSPRHIGMMKQHLLLATIFIGAVPAAATPAMPVTITEGVYVEGAWLRAAESGSELFLVVNNTSDTAIDLTGIGVAGMAGRIVSPDGSRDSISIPYHAELYMTERGLRVAVPATFQPAQAIPVTIATTGGTTATVEAVVLRDDAELPDHHDYQH